MHKYAALITFEAEIAIVVVAVATRDFELAMCKLPTCFQSFKHTTPSN